MSATEWMILIAVIGFMLSGLYLLKDSARSLNLSSEQLEKIRKRNAELDAQEKKLEEDERINR